MCVPWNFPSIDDVPCDPIEQYRFLHTYRSLDMTKVIGTEVCLPNCAETKYTVSVTSAPFRDCDQANLGLTPQCSIDVGPDAIKPHKWAEIVEAAYGGIVPDYLEGKLESPERECAPKFKGKLTFTVIPLAITVLSCAIRSDCIRLEAKVQRLSRRFRRRSFLLQ